MGKRKVMISGVILLLGMSLLAGAGASTVQALDTASETSIASHAGHNLVEHTQKAGCFIKSGNTYSECLDCNVIIEGKKLWPAEKIVLSQQYYTYTGDEVVPDITVLDNNGNVIDNSNYTISCKNNKNIGLATLTVTFTGKYYEGEMELNFGIYPEGIGKTSIKSVSALPSAFAIKWKKQKKIDGYQIQYSTNSSFKKARNIWVASRKADRNAVIDLKGNKKYYVRMRTFRNIEFDNRNPGGDRKIELLKVVYSDWSKKKAVTTKPGNIKNYSAKENPFALYTIMYGDNKLPFYFGKWGGESNMDSKNYAKSRACSKKASDMVYSQYEGEKHISFTEAWKLVGKYNAMSTVQRFVCSVETDNQDE